MHDIKGVGWRYVQGGIGHAQHILSRCSQVYANILILKRTSNSARYIQARCTQYKMSSLSSVPLQHAISSKLNWIFWRVILPLKLILPLSYPVRWVSHHYSLSCLFLRKRRCALPTSHATSAIGPVSHGICIWEYRIWQNEVWKNGVRQYGNLTYPWNHPWTDLSRMAKGITWPAMRQAVCTSPTWLPWIQGKQWQSRNMGYTLLSDKEIQWSIIPLILILLTLI